MHDAKFKFKTVKYEEEEKQVIVDPNVGKCTSLLINVAVLLLFLMVY